MKWKLYRVIMVGVAIISFGMGLHMLFGDVEVQRHSTSMAGVIFFVISVLIIALIVIAAKLEEIMQEG